MKAWREIHILNAFITSVPMLEGWHVAVRAGAHRLGAKAGKHDGEHIPSGFPEYSLHKIDGLCFYISLQGRTFASFLMVTTCPKKSFGMQLAMQERAQASTQLRDFLCPTQTMAKAVSSFWGHFPQASEPKIREHMGTL